MRLKKNTLLLLAMSGIGTLWAVSPDQTNLGILIGENKEQIRFINTCVSNLAPSVQSKSGPSTGGQAPAQTQPSQNQPNQNTTAPPNQNQASPGPTSGGEGVPQEIQNYKPYQLLMKTNQLDFNGNMWYMQSNYSLAFKNLHNAQENLKDLFEMTLEKYIQTARTLLEATSPLIIRSNDDIAKHLLKLGFRDLKNAENFYTVGFNSSPYMYRYKLTQYEEGLRIARRARKFALLAMIASKTPIEDKPEYQFLDLDEYRKVEPVEDLSGYEKIRNTLINFIDNGLLEQKVSPPAGIPGDTLDILAIHDDNYGFITNGKLSLLHISNSQIQPENKDQLESLPPKPQN